MSNNKGNVSAHLTEILDIKRELEQIIKEKDIVYIWEEKDRIRKLLNLINEVKGRLKEPEHYTIKRLKIHLFIFLEHKEKIKNIVHWYKILNLYLDRFVNLIKMSEKLEDLVNRDSGYSNIVEYDKGTLVELSSQKHPYEKFVERTVIQTGEILRDSLLFASTAPLLILVRKQQLGDYSIESPLIDKRLRETGRNFFNREEIPIFEAIYRVKTKPTLLGILYVDDAYMAIVPTIIAVPDKGTILHEKIHFLSRLVFSYPSSAEGGIMRALSPSLPPEQFSAFAIEFLPYLVQYGNIKIYIDNLRHKTFPFKPPISLDDQYLKRLIGFGEQAELFIKKNPFGLLYLIFLYPLFKNEESNDSNTWKDFDVPKNPLEDIKKFELYLSRNSCSLSNGIKNPILIEYLSTTLRQNTEFWLHREKTLSDLKNRSKFNYQK